MVVQFKIGAFGVDTGRVSSPANDGLDMDSLDPSGVGMRETVGDQLLFVSG